MKRKLLYILTALAVGALVWSCTDAQDEFDGSMLAGYWKSGTEYWFYRVDGDGMSGSGYTWDTADDVSESEAQDFTWTLDGDDFTQIHIMYNGNPVPKYYTMLKLTSSTLQYEDYTSKVFTFSKTSKP